MISRSRSYSACLAFVALVIGGGALLAAPREPWTTSRVEGSPVPPKAFVAEQVFPGLTFAEGLELVAVPRARRWLVVERRGKVLTFAAQAGVESADEVVDLLALHPRLVNAFSVVLHPRFRENRQIFVCYALTAGLADGTRVSRFTLSSLEPLRADPQSEEIILSWRAGGHNGCSLQFGNDGYLYISAGDAGPAAPPDLYNTGQDVSDLEGSILRLDVDRRDPGRNYRVPPDNPWAANAPGGSAAAGGGGPVRPELWAYGLRNPWRMSFDRVTGDLWCGDIGWELWELIHLIRRGGNYGWSAFEGSQSIKPELFNPLAPITRPVVAHSHAEAASITGGFVYRGQRFPELTGAYVYGDYITGKIWALWYDGRQVTRHEEIADTPHAIVTFGQDDDGELYYLHFPGRSTVHRLVRNPQAAPAAPFPRSLGATGVFADVARRVPAPGVYPFSITTPMWEDGAVAERLIALRGSTGITTEVRRRPGQKGRVRPADYTITWPEGAVLVRTLTLGRLAATPAERDKPVETQLLHFDGEAWNAYAYRWNEAGTDADLVPAEGAEVTLRVAADPHAPGARSRDYTWRFEARAECLRCHNLWNKGALAFTAGQLVRTDEAQRRALLERRIVDEDFFDQGRTGDAVARSDAAARALLHVNCATCHTAHAGGAVAIFLGEEMAMDEMKLVGVTPAQGGLGLKEPKLVDPGEPWNSVLAVRMAKLGAGHMPLIGSREVDVEGLKVIEDWIARMPAGNSGLKPWTTTRWDEALLERELATVNGAMRVRRAIDDGKLDAELRAVAFRIAWAAPEPTVRDIFERFKPDALRERTLGAAVDPADVLRVPGDAARGARLVAMDGKLASCVACHVIQGQGRHFGPDLSRIGAQQTPAQLLESLLAPAKTIAPLYRATLIEQRDGTTQLGFVRARGVSELVLSIPGGQSAKIKLADIAAEKAFETSLMPEGQLQGLTLQEAADLVAYLAGLR